MDERLKALIPEKKQKVESPPPEEKKGGFMAGLLKVIGGLGLIAGLALVTMALPVLGPILLGPWCWISCVSFRKTCFTSLQMG